MSNQPFGASERVHRIGEPGESLPADGLYGEAFHEISCREAAPGARPSAGGQNVIAAAGVVPKRLRRPGTEEDGAGGTDLVEQVGGTICNAEVLGGKAVDKCTGGRKRGREKDGSGAER